MTRQALKKLFSFVLTMVLIVGTVYVGEVSKVKAATSGITSITVAGNGSGNWLNGENWNAVAIDNHMTETSEDVWEITYESVATGDYEFKFAANNAWVLSFGGKKVNEIDTHAVISSGQYYDVTSNSGLNYKLTVDAISNITMRLDLRNYNGTDGANVIVVVTPVENEVPPYENPPQKGNLIVETQNVSYSGFSTGWSGDGWRVYESPYVDHSTTFIPLPGFKIEASQVEFSYWDGDEWIVVPNDYTIYMFNDEYNGTKCIFAIFAGYLNQITGYDIQFKLVVKAVESNSYPTYIVTGSEELTGYSWKDTWVNNKDNIMSLEGSKYTKTYSDVQPGDYELKVVRYDSLNEKTWIGEDGGNDNVAFSVQVPCDVTVIYDPATNDIDIEYTYITSLTVAGNGNYTNYNWLSGSTWIEDDETNHMEYLGNNIWGKTYYGLKPNDYEFKIALNDSWQLSLGTNGNMVSGTYYDATRYSNDQNSGKSTFTLTDNAETNEVDTYNLHLRVDLSEYDPITGTGAKIMMITVPFENIPVYGGEIVASGMVDHKTDNLVFSGNKYRYYNGYVSTLYPVEGYKLPSSVSIYCEDDTSIVMEEGVHYTYDSSTGKILIKEDAQSYTLLSWPSHATTIIEAEAVPIYPLYLVAGDAAFTGSDWNDEKDGNEANHMTKVGSEFVKTYTNVPRGNYSLKVVKYGDENANPTWIGKDGTDANVTFSVGTACDVTVKYNPATNKITVEGVGLVNYLFEHMSIAGETALFGSNWTPVAMTYSAASGKWEYMLTNVSAGDYLYKYTADSAWTHSWGDEGWYGSSVNYPLSVEYDGSTVIFKVDLLGADMLNPSSVRLTNTEVEIIKPVYDVTFDLDSEITKTGNDTVTAGDVYTATLNAASGFNLPSDKSGIIITINGSRLEEQYYEYNSTTGIISIQSGVIIGDVDIVASATPVLPDEYDVTPPADNNIDITGESTATEGEEYSMTLIPKTGYVLPQSIIIKIGGVETDDFTYNNETGKITIPGDKVNGEIEVIAVAQVIDDESNNQNESTENESTENESTNSGESTEESTTKDGTTEESTTKDGTTEEKTTEEGTNNKNDSSNNLNNQAGNGLGGSGNVGGQNSSNAKPGDSAGSKLVVFVFMAAVGALGLMLTNKKRTLTE